MSEDPLVVLRSALAAKLIPELLISAEKTEENKTDDISKASTIYFAKVPGLIQKSEGTDGANGNGEVADESISFPLDTKTRFKTASGEFIDLRSVYCVYLTQDLNISQYIDYCNERDITHIKFMERTELLTWLQGVDTESSYIVSQTSATEATSGAESAQENKNESLTLTTEVDPRLQLIYENEIALVDHNTVLRGSKPVDFSNLTKVCQDNIMLHFKNKQQQSKSKSRVEKTTSSASSRNRDPIILISPSASSLLNMSNAKEFLENGRFDPNTGGGTTAPSNIQMISHNTKRMGTLRFVVTDSIERFTKDEHWDRVVAVFTTGQAWQFKPYKWSDPFELFQKTKGFCLIYDNENVPGEVKNWNVETLNLNRNRRFKDQEVHEQLWMEIERWMEKRGWGNKSRR